LSTSLASGYSNDRAIASVPNDFLHSSFAAHISLARVISNFLARRNRRRVASSNLSFQGILKHELDKTRRKNVSNEPVVSWTRVDSDVGAASRVGDILIGRTQVGRDQDGSEVGESLFLLSV
jgi:hypothetical protein